MAQRILLTSVREELGTTYDAPGAALVTVSPDTGSFGSENHRTEYPAGLLCRLAWRCITSIGTSCHRSETHTPEDHS